MPEKKGELERIQSALTEADDALVSALDARARAIRSFLDLRKQDPDGYYALPRDADVLGRARDSACDFPKTGLEPVLREVLSASAALVAEVTVAYLGPPGGFAQVAARRSFGSAAELRPAESVSAVLENVERERVSYGIVPLETSSDGALTATLHGLVEADVKISGELTLDATYDLFSMTGSASDIEKVYGASGAIVACERYVRAHFPRATVLDVPSGEVAAQFARQDHGAAAVGPAMIGELYDLRLVKRRIEDDSGVEARFAIVGKGHPSRTGSDRTVLALAVRDDPGSLYRALQPFADRDINLTRLESRPSRATAWRYLFFVELDGHITDRPVLTAIEELRSTSRFVKVLGSYPRPG